MGYSKNSIGFLAFLTKRRGILLYLLFLNLISNLAGAYIHHGLLPIVQMCLLSFFSAFLEYLFILITRPNLLRRFLFLNIILIHNVIIILDYFLILKFQNIICQEIIEIISETNNVEISNFLNTYIHFHTIIIWLAFIISINFLLYKIANSIVLHRFLLYFFLLISFMGLIFWCVMVYNYALYRNGMNIPQYHSVTRLTYSCLILNERKQETISLRNVAKNYVAQSSNNPPNIVVIIGESASIYHSQLYGYNKPTSPLLKKRFTNGEMAIFDDVVTTDDHTHGAMMSVFSLCSQNKSFKEKPLFPMCFKSAGYNTAIYDNQYFVGGGINFLTDDYLSSIMFDYRNSTRYRFDGDMIVDSVNLDSPYLKIFHLWGQHYTYSERYPEEFKHFKASDYDKDKYSINQREIIAHYDNATLYNDFVINEIIKQNENNDCCVIYFSDHGEEVFDFRDYMGHGNAAHSNNINYQIRVPLFIWVSEVYKKNRPKIVNMIFKNTKLPVSTDDVPHLILNLANIRCKDFDSTRSVINADYLIKHRIVLKSLDYDVLK